MNIIRQESSWPTHSHVHLDFTFIRFDFYIACVLTDFLSPCDMQEVNHDRFGFDSVTHLVCAMFCPKTQSMDKTVFKSTTE